MYKIEIEPIENGALVKVHSESDDGSKDIITARAYKFDSNGDGPIGEVADMFYDILDYFGLFSSRYAKERPQIRIVHGDKYDCQDKKCCICHRED